MKTLRHKGYLGSAEISTEDNCLHGQILYVKDLVTYEAENPAELQSAFEAAVEDYLQTCAQIGKCPDKPFSGSFNVRIPPEQHRSVAIAATQNETSLNSWIAEAIKAKLEGRGGAYHHDESHYHISEGISSAG